MEKVLKLYKYIDGSNDTPFPNVEYQAVVSDFRYDVKRMGGAPIITCTVMHTLCLDKLWSDNVYAYFNGEKFFIKQIPTSSYSNTDSRYKHELELVSERFVLDNVYFYDVVDSSENNDKPVSNSSKFSFFGDINEFASRLNQSLQYSNVDYSVVVDDGISSEAKMVSFQDQFFSGAIQEGYNTYNVPFYFEGKVIHFGYTNNAITRTFKYGDKESLLSIQKQNANYKVVNRVTGVGSADNIPYYYPNDYESKEEVEENGGTWVNPQTNLMPSIYRETLGKERFYEALNNTYKIPNSSEYYEFENPYIEGKPKEHIVNFDYIKPTIKGITNSEGLRIDMFKEFAYDANDNDEVDEEGNYLHPYFFAKLRKFDGEHGFNLFDHAIDEQEMVISMTSGSCGACEFAIGVDETTQKNIVQVDNNGDLVRDDNGNVKFGSAQDRQNDTSKYDVWIALRKDIDTFGVVMPNASKNYRPSTNDTFVILHIDLPKAYILAAEDKLKEELIKYMSLNNSEKFNFSISFSRIFFAENPSILEQLNENARIQIEYDNTTYELYISSYSYSMSKDVPLPEIRIELSDTLTISQNALQTAISEVKSEILQSGVGVSGGDILKRGLKYFLRKDTDDRSKGKISTDKAIEVGNYVSGASGAIIYKDAETGKTVGELDKLYVRMKAYFETLDIINVNTVGGKQIISPAGSVRCVGVEETESEYLCYFLAEQDGEKVENRWNVGDQAYSQMFNAKAGVSNNISNKYYWRLVTSVSSDSVEFEGKQCHYIALSKTDCDSYSDVPSIGDVINHRGSRTDLDRMNFIEMSSVDAFSPNITLFHGVNSYSLDGKAYVSYGVDKSNNKAFMDVYGDMYVGDRKGGSYMRYTQENGLEISGTLSVGTKLGDTPLKDLISASSPEGYQEFVEKVTQDIEGLQNQIDGAIESYFYQYDPTLGNYPASEWIANGTEKAHLNDTFTNLASGYSWRWSLDGTTYKWVEITDTATTKALALAGQAKDTADGKRRVFVDTPYPPYDKGDLWSRGSEYPLMICLKTKDKNGVYEASDFDYADNNAKLKEEMQDLVGNTKDELNNAIGQAKNEAVNNANAYTDEGKKALQASIDAMESTKANLNDVYTRAQADGKISETEAKALKAAEEEADAAIAYYDTIVKAYADGVATEEELKEIQGARAALDAAKKYAEEQAQQAIDEANDTYGYLARALGTEVDGGLLLTSLIQMRDTDQNIMSGINGLTAKGDKSIATWWGGGMYDMLDYYDLDGSKWVAKKNIQIPSNVPSGVIRMDGTGYLAKGKFWWDASGKIYADPTALFLMFDVEDESASLSQTILAMRDKQTEFADMWEFKTDANGRKYLLSKYPLVTQEGITMYSGVGTTIPSIYDGLPIDGDTIYWEGGYLKAKCGGSIGGATTLGGLSNVGTWADSVADVDRIMYQQAGSSSWVAKSLSSIGVGSGGGLDITALQNYLTSNSYLNATEGDNRYLKLSGGTLASSGNPLSIKRTDGNVPGLVFYSENTQLGSIGISTDYIPKFYNANVGLLYTIWHEGNFKPSNYLPLSGGTMTGNILLGGTTTNKIGTNIVDTSGGFQEFTHQNSNGYIALGPFNGSVAHIYTDRPSFYFNKDLYVNDAKVWHAGNDGGGSGLDADLLDGKHNGELTASILHSGGGFVIDTNTIQFSDFSLRFYSGIPNTSTNLPTSSGYQNGLLVLPLHTNGSTAQIYLSVGKNPYFRSHHTYEWNELAYKTDNVASATKLQTARTIWGHNFDGTENVFGQLYLNASKIVWHDDANNYYIGCPTVTGGAMLEYKAYSGHAFLGGNVGIGTASPKQKLHVEGHIWANGDIAAKTKIQSFGNLIVNGNVGIGTENPTGKLSVNGTVYLTEGTVDNYSYIRSSNYTNNTARLIIGTCYGYKTEVNALSIYNGQVGIGTTTPTTKFDINGKSMEIGTSIYGSGGVGSEIYMSTHREGSTLCARGMRMYVSGSETGVFQSFSIDAKNYSTLSNIMSINSSGNLLVTGGVTMYSDQRKKTILNHVELSLKQIADAPLIEHYYNSDDKKTTHVGSIAQYWASMNDWFCKLDSEGFYTMEIQNAALASAISIARELDRYETKTDKAINKLKKRICELEEEVERLKSA